MLRPEYAMSPSAGISLQSPQQISHTRCLSPAGHYGRATSRGRSITKTMRAATRWQSALRICHGPRSANPPRFVAYDVWACVGLGLVRLPSGDVGHSGRCACALLRLRSGVGRGSSKFKSRAVCIQISLCECARACALWTRSRRPPCRDGVTPWWQEEVLKEAAAWASSDSDGEAPANSEARCRFRRERGNSLGRRLLRLGHSRSSPQSFVK